MVPPRSARVRMSSFSIATDAESKFAKGSSIIQTCVLNINSLDKATFLFQPEDKCLNLVCNTRCNSKKFTAAGMRLSLPRVLAQNSRISTTIRCSWHAFLWPMYVMSEIHVLDIVIASPLRAIFPNLTGSKPTMERSNEVFPLPFFPAITVIDP
ncbi:hypothetical protein ANAPH2_01392 [Anaplasma phagocytophilum]|nr:hypothetical protein ANAPH2_01392 [Anaplasma phagocytophilum]